MWLLWFKWVRYDGHHQWEIKTGIPTCVTYPIYCCYIVLKFWAPFGELWTSERKVVGYKPVQAGSEREKLHRKHCLCKYRLASLKQYSFKHWFWIQGNHVMTPMIPNYMHRRYKANENLTLLHSERPKLCTILAFLSVVGLKCMSTPL